MTNATNEEKRKKIVLGPEKMTPKEREFVERDSKILAYQLRQYLGANKIHLRHSPG